MTQIARFNFFTRYIDRTPFLASSWLALAWYENFGEVRS